MTLAKRLREETIDVTLPGKGLPGWLASSYNRIKPVTDVFLGMGFSVAEGPEVNWIIITEALNMPRNHPARDTQIPSI